jgi:AcrR family transcriptional regulator
LPLSRRLTSDQPVSNLSTITDRQVIYMDSPSCARKTRWHRRKQERPAEILNSALACFTERGFAATRLDEVAQRAGVTKGTLYLYFDSKEDLFKAVVRQRIIPTLERLEALIFEATAPASLLLERFIKIWPEIIAAPGSAIPKLVIAEAGNFPDLARFYLSEVVHRGMALVSHVLRAGIERGEFREIDLESANACVIAPILYAMLWRHSLGRYEPGALDPQVLCETHLRLLVDGLRTRPAAAVPNMTDPAAAAPENLEIAS